MSDTAKLKAPKGLTAISVLGQEYKIVKGYVTVALEHVEHLVGFGFTGDDGESVDEVDTDPTLPAGMTSDLAPAPAGWVATPAAPAPVDPANAGDTTASATQGGYAINQDAPAADEPAVDASSAPSAEVPEAQ